MVCSPRRTTRAPARSRVHRFAAWPPRARLGDSPRVVRLGLSLRWSGLPSLSDFDHCGDNDDNPRYERDVGLAPWPLLVLSDLSARGRGEGRDHVQPRSRETGASGEGQTVPTCTRCNRLKGARNQARDPYTSDLVQLFDPRSMRWDEHFLLQKRAQVVGRTKIGRATAALLFRATEGFPLDPVPGRSGS